jgi:3-dehydro-L-gulonate 2-dehydrogenase
MPDATLRIPFDELHDTLRRILARHGFSGARADLSARLFAEASLDGVASHGLNRFPRFVQMIRSGVVDAAAEAARVEARGGVERWDGRRGPGNLNAHASMARAMALAREHGIGCVALANTNHWMRGGTYGWQAVDAGAIGICWTNTLANMPAWGGSTPAVGNNPLVIGVPRPSGALVLDIAMSQFSVGALTRYRARGERLPVAGGFDADGRLSDDPAAIESSGRLLPIGCWKGSGLAILLDVVAALVAGGQATFQIPAVPEEETALSQMFIAFDPALLTPAAGPLLDAVVDRLHASARDGETITYPGERTLATRRRNLELGVPVDADIWQRVRTL